MSAARAQLGMRALLLAACLAVTACATIGPAPSRPRPAPTPQPAPSSRAAEAPASPGAVSPDAAPPPAVTPQASLPRAPSDARSASSALLAQSRSERAAGSYAQATASIERALRLDPNNAELWVERGEIALQTGNTAQAATMAQKALTLTGGDRTLTARAERLLRAASSP